jgi:hypothetical protein
VHRLIRPTATLLLPVLVFTTFLSVLSLGFLLSLFFIHRLYLNVKSVTPTGTSPDFSHLTAGTKSFIAETKARIGLPAAIEVEEKPTSSGVSGVKDLGGVGVIGMGEKYGNGKLGFAGVDREDLKFKQDKILAEMADSKGWPGHIRGVQVDDRVSDAPGIKF